MKACMLTINMKIKQISYETPLYYEELELFYLKLIRWKNLIKLLN